ncbi:hypothetical protein CHARACLAT_008338 [Characodon lateralis]|uniref:Uncharacterized protein n=1 Tax=Characodon lateralis TaxID=208331 RepID=A0ABU7E839_9TELE|nr:hypothetical protein [Characodon lateralis]
MIRLAPVFHLTEHKGSRLCQTASQQEGVGQWSLYVLFPHWILQTRQGEDTISLWAFGISFIFTAESEELKRKLAQKTGAQKAAKRLHPTLSTPNASAAGYPPTPC